MPNSQSLTTYARGLTIILIVLLLPCAVEPSFPWDSLSRLMLTILEGPSGPRPSNTSDPTLLMNASGVIRFHGYPFENHTVVTEDGHILELHRIPHGKHSKTTKHTQPLLILPGLMVDSGVYVGNGEKNSAGFIFADAGYDVWLHNNRGTRYTKKHTSLSTNDKKFWNFSFHEMGLYDLPAAIDHILSITKSKQVYLMGLSMGGTIISIFLAEKPSYERKVKAAFLLAPAIYLGHTKYRLPQNYTFLLKLVIHMSHDMNVLPYSQNYEKSLIYMKTEHKTLVKLFAKIATEYPDNKLELIKRNRFAHYDYRRQRNLKEYKQTSPPAYNLGNSKVPVFIMYADKDLVVVPEDVLRGSREFGNLVRLIRVPDDEFQHLDFVMHDDTKTLVYDTILAEMEKSRNVWSKWTMTQQKTVSLETAKTKTSLSEATQAEAAPSATAETEEEQEPSASTENQLFYPAVTTIFIILIAGLVLAFARIILAQDVHPSYKKFDKDTRA